MSKSKRPTTSGYARIAQAEDEDSHSDSDDDEELRTQTLSTTQYAPIQPQRSSTMRMSGASGSSSPTRQKTASRRRPRSNSGVDIKAINARLERWAEEIAQKFKIKRQKDAPEEKLEIHHSVFQAPEWIRPATAESLASSTVDCDRSCERMTKLQFDDAVESVRTAIEMDVHPKLISQGSSGSYFAQSTQGNVVGVFKPKDEEPYASRNPKWTKWIHRNLFPFFFGRACLIPNLSYVSEAAAYVLDTQLRTNLVPYTEVVSLSSKSFHYDFWDRRAYRRKKKPFPEKPGSFQVFLKGFKDANVFLKEYPWPDQNSLDLLSRGDTRKKKKRRWAEDCRPSGPQSDDDEDNSPPGTADQQGSPRAFWTDALQQSFREQLEKLVILDYIMRNTDRGPDNWMIKIGPEAQAATVNGKASHKRRPNNYSRQSMGESDPYGRREQMTADSRSNTPMPDASSPTVSIGAIDNSLSWPWKHPDAWRSYPFGWLFLPVSLIGQPFSEATRRHFLPLLTSKPWWSETQLALRKCFIQDDDFKERMYAKQVAVMKGQAWNVVETLKTPDHGPLELTRRARVCVWDDIVEIPIAVPLKVPIAETREGQPPTTRRNRMREEEHEEMDIATMPAPAQTPSVDFLMNSPPLETAHENRFNLSRESPSFEAGQSGYASPVHENRVSWQARDVPGLPNARPGYRSHISFEVPRRKETRQHRRYSLSHRRGLEGHGFDDDGDLGYAANADMESHKKRVIVERLETVKGRNPVFTWC